MDMFSDPTILVENNFVSEKWVRFSEILQDFDPTLSLRWIPPNNRDAGDSSRAYAVVHSPSGRPEYIVMFAGEGDDPEKVLTALWMGNTAKHDVLGRAQAAEAAQKAFHLKEWEDRLAEAADQAAWMAGTHKNWITIRKEDGTLEKIDRTLPNGGRG